MYDLPPLKKPRFKKGVFGQSKTLRIVVLSIFVSSFFGLLAGTITGLYFYSEIRNYLQEMNIELPGPQIIEKITETVSPPSVSQEEEIVKVVENISPAVVSIIVTKDLPVVEQYFVNPFGEERPFGIPQYRQKGTEKKEIGGGTGFIVSSDGLVVTNKHVVLDEEADYTVLTNDGSQFSAEVLARDPLQDLAVLKINRKKASFSVVELGDSSLLKIGQTVIAIGNALGEFRNTVSVGVISGLGRTITASGGGFVETIEDVIQTDAAINKGNSGGPLLNLQGEVIGINTATVLGAQNIGFAIPVNKAKKDIKQVKEGGKIIYPFLGIRYILINPSVQENRNLPVDYGALIIRGEASGEVAVVPGSAADKAGLEEGDIVLEFDGQKITLDNSLAKLIQRKEPGDRVALRVLRGGGKITLFAVLEGRSD